MKKLLVLLMVSGLAASAQAALSLSLSSATVAVHGDVTLSVISSDSSQWTGDLILSEDLVNWTLPIVASYNGSWTATSHAGDACSNIQDTIYAAAYLLTAAGNTVSPSAGTQFSIAIRGVQTGTIGIGLQNPTTYANIATPLTLTVTPEPMTIALLGLGGLLLRRRK